MMGDGREMATISIDEFCRRVDQSTRLIVHIICARGNIEGDTVALTLHLLFWKTRHWLWMCALIL